MVTFLPPLRFGRFQVRLFYRDQEQMCHKCNRWGHFARGCPNLVCFNCDNSSRITKECPDSPRWCICKSLNHLPLTVSIHGVLPSLILLVLLPVIILQLLILNQMLPLPKWILRIHRMFLLQLLLTSSQPATLHAFILCVLVFN